MLESIHFINPMPLLRLSSDNNILSNVLTPLAIPPVQPSQCLSQELIPGRISPLHLLQPQSIANSCPMADDLRPIQRPYSFRSQGSTPGLEALLNPMLSLLLNQLLKPMLNLSRNPMRTPLLEPLLNHPRSLRYLSKLGSKSWDSASVTAQLSTSGG